MSAEPDPYLALELSPGSSLEQVKEQYRRLAKVNHPDLNPEDRIGCEARLRRINAAYASLSNPTHKALLDWRWEQKQSARRTTPPQTARPARPSAAGRPLASAGRKAKRQSPAAARSGVRKPVRPKTREERKRIRIAAAAIALALSLTLVGVVYYQWFQSPSVSRTGSAPSLSDGAAEDGARNPQFSPISQMIPAPIPEPLPMSPSSPVSQGAGDAPIDLQAGQIERLARMKTILQQRLDEVDPKVDALVAEARAARSLSSQSPPSTAATQWRERLETDSQELLVERNTLRIEIGDLTWSRPESLSDALEHIKQSSVSLDRQFQLVRGELTQKPR